MHMPRLINGPAYFRQLIINVPYSHVHTVKKVMIERK